MRRFQFKLALALGMTRGELIRTMSSREQSEWLAYFRLQDKPAAAADDDETQLRKVFGSRK